MNFLPKAEQAEDPFKRAYMDAPIGSMQDASSQVTFSCTQCGMSLSYQKYVMREEKPYCVCCYETLFANVCIKCKDAIGINCKDLTYQDKHWHEYCFICCDCKSSLVDKPFGSKDSRIYCAECYDQAFAERCDGCRQTFKGGSKKLEFRGQHWHEACFKCILCKENIGSSNFIPKNDLAYCLSCYEQKFSTQCKKCNKPIMGEGISYRNEPWHKDCFVCINCKSNLAGQRFTVKEEEPYCTACYGELFAKRCNACHKPITLGGPTKFVSFESHHWHNDCFFCANCKLSLVGKGFVTDETAILCPPCAQAKVATQVHKD